MELETRDGEVIVWVGEAVITVLEDDRRRLLLLRYLARNCRVREVCTVLYGVREYGYTWIDRRYGAPSALSSPGVNSTIAPPEPN